MSETLYLNALWNPEFASAPPPDLTGANSQYYNNTDRYGAYITGSQLIFDQTVYQQWLVITPDGGAPWVYGTDWTVNSNDIDSVATATAVAMLSSFSLVLLKSITILRTIATPVFLTVASQSFYPRPETLPPLPDADNALTALLESIVARLDTAENVMSRITTTTSSGSSLTPALLTFDINKSNSANLISSEPYLVNTYNGQNTICPIQGSFFKDSLILTVNGTTLTAGTDYQAVCLNSGKTKLTVNPSGIYDLILLTYAYAGPVYVTYHAVGGEATVSDLNAVYQNVVNIKAFLNDSSFITPDQLLSTPAIQNILNKLCATENQMRVLLSGAPNYGDSTNGVSVVKTLSAPDTGLHWYTIGALYKVAGSTAIVYSDRMNLHIQLTGAKLSADIGIGFDTRLTDPLIVTSTNVTQDTQFVLYGAVGTPANVVMPQFRVIWNNPSTYVSGALLQIGLNLPSLTEVIAIEDRSGVESCWLLNTTTGNSLTPLTPQDNTIVLPDGSSVWTVGGPTSTSATHTMPNHDGYLVWAGTKSIATFDTTIGMTTLTNNLPNWFAIGDITEIIAEFVDASSNALRVIVPMSGSTTTARRGIGMLYIGTVSPVPFEIDVSIVSGAVLVQVEVQSNVQTAPVTNMKFLVAKLGNTGI